MEWELALIALESIAKKVFHFVNQEPFQLAVAGRQPVLQLVLPIAAVNEHMQAGLVQSDQKLSVGCLEQMLSWEAGQLTGASHRSDGRDSYPQRAWLLRFRGT